MTNVNDLHCMIDLHCHLDGAISLESARQLAKMQGIMIPDSDEELLRIMRVGEDCRDLNEFLEKFDFPCSLIQTEDSVRVAFTNLLTELKGQGLVYAEIRFAPQLSTGKGMTQDEAVAAAIGGMKAVNLDSGLILCCIRGDDNHEENIETVNVAEKYLGKGVVAVDLAGAEALFPTEGFADIFALAREKKIPVTIHAGEADGPESVRKALEMGASRIGHGVRALEDEDLVKELAEKQIPLELCPTSNVDTAIVRCIADWPLPKLLDAGLLITINTDDPSIEGTTIKDEYNRLIENFGLSAGQIKKFLINAANASFAGDDVRKKLIDRIETSFPDHDEKKTRLFLSQKETLDTFLRTHAITKAQYQKSYGDLVVKMGMQEIAEKLENETYI